jgi:hypothetical protein
LVEKKRRRKGMVKRKKYITRDKDAENRGK